MRSFSLTKLKIKTMTMTMITIKNANVTMTTTMILTTIKSSIKNLNSITKIKNKENEKK